MALASRDKLHRQIDALPDDLVVQLSKIASLLASRHQNGENYADWDEAQWNEFALEQFFQEEDDVFYTLDDAREIFSSATLPRFELPQAVQVRLQYLLDQQDTGEILTSTEREEAKGLVELAEFLSLLQLRALRATEQSDTSSLTPKTVAADRLSALVGIAALGGDALEESEMLYDADTS